MKLLCLCSGNTCRSPMLAALLKRTLNERGLVSVSVESAGTGAHDGDSASAEAIAAMVARDIDLHGHRSRNARRLRLSDYDRVLAMTSSHAAFARSHGVPAEHLEVVNADHGGVPDPFGGGQREYEQCAQVLERCADQIADSLTIAGASALRSTDTPHSAGIPNSAIPVSAIHSDVILPVTTPAQPMPLQHEQPIVVKALQAIDHVHAGEPSPPAGKPSERAYADHIDHWISILMPAASVELRLAARCQHLERWAIPRNSFPLDKVGYLTWRKAVHRHQGQRAADILIATGIDQTIAHRVNTLVAKAADKGDADAQALEDAACLTFLATELSAFASHHPDYTRDKFVDIIRKTWKKMSPRAHALALTIPLPDALKELLKAAIT